MRENCKQSLSCVKDFFVLCLEKLYWISRMFYLGIAQKAIAAPALNWALWDTFFVANPKYVGATNHPDKPLATFRKAKFYQIVSGIF